MEENEDDEEDEDEDEDDKEDEDKDGEDEDDVAYFCLTGNSKSMIRAWWHLHNNLATKSSKPIRYRSTMEQTSKQVFVTCGQTVLNSQQPNEKWIVGKM